MGLLVFALFLMSAVAPAAVERSIPVAPFHAIDLAVKATMRVEQAPVASVVAIGDPRVVRCVSASTQDGRLTIGWAGRGTTNRQSRTAGDDIVVTAPADCKHKSDVQRLTIRIVAPVIDAVTIRDRGIVRVSSVRMRTFTAGIPGSGSITIERLRASATTLLIAGSGRIDATGDLGQLAVSIPGSGVVDARSARANAINVTIAGSGNVAATVDGPATGALAGSGTIAIGGRPICAISNPGGGRIRCPAASNTGDGA